MGGPSKPAIITNNRLDKITIIEPHNGLHQIMMYPVK